MSSSWSRLLGLMVALPGLCLGFGCGSKAKIHVGSACELNSDCQGSLVCTMGKCHDACHKTSDCPAGQSCVKTADSVVCQLPAEASCSGTSACSHGLSCAPDLRCRTSCAAEANCTPGQICASSYCADPGDPNLANGQLANVGGSDAGTFDGSSPDWLAVSPADVLPVDSGAEAVTSPDAADAPFAPDAPAPEVGRSCTSGCDDGLYCTSDACVDGTCQNVPSPGACIIDKVCYKAGDTKPGDVCQACISTTSTSVWSPAPEGTLCATGKSCQAHGCAACGGVGQACCGTAATGNCVEGAACNANTKQCQADKAIDISGSEDTVCALFQSGSVRCWGGNGPMLGASAGSNRAAPPIAGLQDAVSLSVGYGTACAVRRTGAVFCWGSALAGGAPVSGITNATQVSAGPHTCVRTSDSKVLCWGTNNYGELGIGTTATTSVTTPQEMLGMTDAQSVAACGNATCVLRKGGQISCTGSAQENGQASAASTLTDLPAASNATSLSCSHSHAGQIGYFWAVTQNAGMLTWGWGMSSPGNALGVGQVLSATWVVDSSYGRSSYLAIQSDNTLWSVGDNTWGQLGDGTFTSTSMHTNPRLIHSASAVSHVKAVAAAWNSFGGTEESTCLLLADGGISCAGRNGSSTGSALGDGQLFPQAPRAYFVPVAGILPVASEDGQCYDGIDNDGDGKSDLDDSDCAQSLGSSTGAAVATAPFTGVFGNYLQESCKGAFDGYGGPEAVLTWTAPSSGRYQFDTSGSTFDTLLAAYKGNPMTSTALDCSDDAASLGASGASAVSVQVNAGDKVTLVVDSKAAPTGPTSFTVNITKI